MAVHENVVEQVSLASTYVFNLARYDQDYDVRDRTRFLKHLIFSQQLEIAQYAREVLLATKPAPKARVRTVGKYTGEDGYNTEKVVAGENIAYNILGSIFFRKLFDFFLILQKVNLQKWLPITP